MLANVELAGFRSVALRSAVLSSNSYSDGSISWLPRLLLRSRVEGGLVEDERLFFRLVFCGLRRKMWTVSVAEDTERSVDVELKDMLYILAWIEPRRNWYSFVPSGTEKTRMMVPFSDAVASRVPSLFKAMQDNGELCASITFAGSSFVASYIMTPPLVGGLWPDFGGAWGGGWKVTVGALVGSGYAR